MKYIILILAVLVSMNTSAQESAKIKKGDKVSLKRKGLSIFRIWGDLLYIPGFLNIQAEVLLARIVLYFVVSPISIFSKI